MHPNTEALLKYLKEESLKYFKYEHLPPHLQEVSRPFCDLARQSAEKYDGPELIAGLRHLMEAKDCIVRAALPNNGTRHAPAA